MPLKDFPGEHIVKGHTRTALTPAAARVAKWGSDRIFDMIQAVPRDFSAHRDPTGAVDVGTVVWPQSHRRY